MYCIFCQILQFLPKSSITSLQGTKQDFALLESHIRNKIAESLAETLQLGWQQSIVPWSYGYKWLQYLNSLSSRREFKSGNRLARLISIWFNATPSKVEILRRFWRSVSSWAVSCITSWQQQHVQGRACRGFAGIWQWKRSPHTLSSENCWMLQHDFGLRSKRLPPILAIKVESWGSCPSAGQWSVHQDAGQLRQQAVAVYCPYAARGYSQPAQFTLTEPKLLWLLYKVEIRIAAFSLQQHPLREVVFRQKSNALLQPPRDVWPGCRQRRGQWPEVSANWSWPLEVQWGERWEMGAEVTTGANRTRAQARSQAMRRTPLRSIHPPPSSNTPTPCLLGKRRLPHWPSASDRAP